MSVIEDRKASFENAEEAAPPEAERDTTNRVPEWAEDMEHTLRRLIKKRQKERDQHPGLYR